MSSEPSGSGSRVDSWNDPGGWRSHHPRRSANAGESFLSELKIQKWFDSLLQQRAISFPAGGRKTFSRKCSPRTERPHRSSRLRRLEGRRTCSRSKTKIKTGMNNSAGHDGQTAGRCCLSHQSARRPSVTTARCAQEEARRRRPFVIPPSGWDLQLLNPPTEESGRTERTFFPCFLSSSPVPLGTLGS
ncbi:hypothetical protein OJAV_G00186980 [Oryzias javanicus]|uniref:Uncharacterized protein n=1 Tax=Oryzias javanicus TaxID=123683 RepID=A0A437C976_ORYJA|nr:hypothetical protein OJAV_G00186980 [Oryzias javanicus]